MREGSHLQKQLVSSKFYLRRHSDPLAISTFENNREPLENFHKLSTKLFAAELLKPFSQTELEAHLRINEAISRTLREWRDPARRLF